MRARLRGGFAASVADMSAAPPLAEESDLPEASRGMPNLLRWQESSVRLIALLMTLILIVGLAYLIRAQVTSSTVTHFQSDARPPKFQR